MNAARANDALIAARVVETLQPLESLLQSSKPTPTAGNDSTRRRPAPTTRTQSSWKPCATPGRCSRGCRAARPSTNCRTRDKRTRTGSGGRAKLRQSKSLVVSANNFQPDPLKDLRLDAKQVTAAATANWMSAMKYTRLAEQSLPQLGR
jgi:hypothetical protein